MEVEGFGQDLALEGLLEDRGDVEVLEKGAVP